MPRLLLQEHLEEVSGIEILPYSPRYSAPREAGRGFVAAAADGVDFGSQLLAGRNRENEPTRRLRETL